MIDEKNLDALEELVRLHPNGTHAVFVEGKTHGAWSLDSEVLGELVRLSRLGLWAENQGAPTIKFVSENVDHDDPENGEHDFSDFCLLCALKQALELLPENKKKKEFYCCKCGETFDHLTLLETHLVSHENNP